MTMWPSRTRFVSGGQGRQRGERLERDLVGRARDRVEVVEQPDRLEAELVGLPGDRDGPSPGIRRIPAVVLADPALRDDDSDLHAGPPRSPADADGRRIEPARGEGPAERAMLDPGGAPWRRRFDGWTGSRRPSLRSSRSSRGFAKLERGPVDRELRGRQPPGDAAAGLRRRPPTALDPARQGLVRLQDERAERAAQRSPAA